MTVKIKAIGNVTFISGHVGSGRTTKMLELAKASGKSVALVAGERRWTALLRAIEKVPQEVVAVDDFLFNLAELDGVSKRLETLFPDKKFLITV